ncbi:DUF1194 domain-containing protein [Falsiroseomonas tokyonensis]|uniref:DUF1194 domain-containing protein n=1 Tax=Falsiroseomonas tokyonensis TaxID=430521 RepID=A0ABV7BVJ3_9PROT|nr:DUF1194 domain-containing protein [Falsiroseomonas tokyonensis]MBU8538500.1 DUF1194 domain-containing protein [Falsiroseomonas tokyonensis]
MDSVDIALCLAMDVSASVDFEEFRLMAGGTAAALRDPAVLAAATAGPRGAAALALLLWSGPGQQDLAVGWTRLADAEGAAALAEAIENTPRLPAAGATALGEGMAAGLAVLARAPGDPTRLVLDVSGDGRHNAGRAPGPVRDLAVAAGLTVNGLAILNEEPDLMEHYVAEVIGGPGSFAMPCADYVDFAEAILRKLRRELLGGMLVV